MPCQHDQQLPEADIVVYDNGCWGSTSSDERVDEARMWARAHRRTVLAQYTDSPFGGQLPEFDKAAAFLDEHRSAWLLITHAEALHQDESMRRFLATRVGGRVICMSGESIPNDYPVDDTTAADGSAAQVAS